MDSRSCQRGLAARFYPMNITCFMIERTGTPPLLTVSPSIGREHTDGTPGWRYHGFLREGDLSDA